MQFSAKRGIVIAPVHGAHRAVIFAIAQLSCLNYFLVKESRAIAERTALDAAV